MIANGRRIDQRSTMDQVGGVDWFRRHLVQNGFDPIDFDGRDPAAFTWAIFEIEERLKACAHAAVHGQNDYPVPLHYGIAETVKGFGFPGAGTNRAHNLPLDGNPSSDARAREEFNQGAAKLWVRPEQLNQAVTLLNNHAESGRQKERDHPIVSRPENHITLPEPPWHDKAVGKYLSPMAGIDEYFVELVKANPQLRPRVGNPDEMRSNRMNATLDLLKHRVTSPEAGLAEAIDGPVITALNEEAVVCSALGNKGGLNLVVSYEAFAVKMLGAIRQDLIFTRNMIQGGRQPSWLSVPVLATSHAWENGKNELSHQDPTLGEALMGEMSDLSRIVFPADWNSAVACLRETYSSRGQIWTMMVPKRHVPIRLTKEQANALVDNGALRLRGNCGSEEKLQLIAVGAYQLAEVLKASDRLVENQIEHSVLYLLEPGRFRLPRDDREASYLCPKEKTSQLFPEGVRARVFLSHTRPESLAGIVRPLDTGPQFSRFLGFLNRGGTLDSNGMLFANKCTWVHVLAAGAEAISLPIDRLLSSDEREAVAGGRSPFGTLF